jgi:hypothetical protein
MLMNTPGPTPQHVAMGVRVGMHPEVLSRLDPDGLDNLEAYVSNSADSTIDSFRFDTIRWVAWAETNDVDPLSPHARQVRDYAKDVEPGLKPASVKRMVSNVGVLTSKIAGNANHTRSMLVTSEMKRQRRKKGSAHKQAAPIRQKGDLINLDEPARAFSIERMLLSLEPDKSLWAARAKLLLSLGGDTGRRGGEYRAAKMSDLRPMDSTGGAGVFFVPQSKTDQSGLGMMKFASARTMRYFDEYRAVLKASGGDVRPNAPLFAPVDRWGVPRCSRGKVGSMLTTKGLIEIIRQVVRRVLPVILRESNEIIDVEEAARGVSGHSFRVGMAQDLVTSGESMVAICTEGNWQTPSMPVLYTRNIAAHLGAAARLAKRLGYG